MCVCVYIHMQMDMLWTDTVVVTQAAIIKHHRLGGLENKHSFLTL